MSDDVHRLQSVYRPSKRILTRLSLLGVLDVAVIAFLYFFNDAQLLEGVRFSVAASVNFVAMLLGGVVTFALGKLTHDISFASFLHRNAIILDRASENLDAKSMEFSRGGLFNLGWDVASLNTMIGRLAALLGKEAALPAAARRIAGDASKTPSLKKQELDTMRAEIDAFFDRASSEE